MFRLIIFLLPFIWANVGAANSANIEEILRHDLAILNAKHADDITLGIVLDSQTDMSRVFHELNKHGALAGKVIARSTAAQQEIKQLHGKMKRYGWQKKQIIAALNVIGLTHDSIYHTDGPVRPWAQVVIRKLMQPHDGGLRFTPAAQEYITYKLLQHINEYNHNLPYERQVGIKLPINNAYGIFKNGALLPRAGTGENELFSAILAEELLRQAAVPVEWQFIVVVGILNTVPFTSPSYQAHFAKAVQECASFYAASLPAGALADAAIKISGIFTNYFDIANYQDGSLLVAYNKMFALEQRPELQRMLHSGKDDWLLISAVALDNNFHKCVLKPKLIAGQAVIFHGTGHDAELNKKAIEAIDYETLFVKARAVGAFLQAAEGRQINIDVLLGYLFKVSESYKANQEAPEIAARIIRDLQKYASLVPAHDVKLAITQGYVSDAVAAKLIKQHGLSAVIAIADFLEQRVDVEKSMLGKKCILKKLLEGSA